MLMTAVSIDIIVPLSLGICSRVRLLAAEATIPKNQLAISISSIESQRLGVKTYAIVNAPDSNAVRLSRFFFLTCSQIGRWSSCLGRRIMLLRLV